MRPIKFQGTCLDTGEGVCGYVKTGPTKTFIVYFESKAGWISIEVDPETVGQYIGQHDKNDVEIYEKNILRGNNDTPGEPDYSYYRVVFYEAAFLVEVWDFIHHTWEIDQGGEERMIQTDPTWYEITDENPELFEENGLKEEK